MFTRAIADSVRVFATAIPVALILAGTLPRQYLMPIAILILGLLTVVYTYKGGMRAVVWTELIQAGVYIVGGISAAVLLGRSVDGGWGAILDQASAAGKLQAIDFSMASIGRTPCWRVVSARPRDGLARRRSADCAAVTVRTSLAMPEGTHWQRLRRLAQFHIVPARGRWSLGILESRPFPTPTRSSLVHHRADAPSGLLVSFSPPSWRQPCSRTRRPSTLWRRLAPRHLLAAHQRRADDPRTLRVGKLFALGWASC